MQYETMLITGGAGFIGSNLAVSFKQKYSELRVIVLDNLKRRGSELNIKRLKESRIEFIHGDTRNQEVLELEDKIDLLLECSAEPSVLSGYGESPASIISTNLVGTINCFELARKNNADVMFLSTSRVYPYNVINNIKTIEADTRFEWAEVQDIKIAGWSKYGIDEDFINRGSKSMYGATKLCSEMILQECISMYGMKGVINRCGAIAGPWQFGKADQGVFTFWMLAHYFKKQLKYIGFGGKGKQVRDLLHIDDLFVLLDLQIRNIDNLNGSIYNVGGGEINLSLFETTQLCESITGNRITIKSEPTARHADLIIYKSNNQRISSILNWKPERNAERILNDIYLWIRDNEKSLTTLI